MVSKDIGLPPATTKDTFEGSAGFQPVLPLALAKYNCSASRSSQEPALSMRRPVTLSWTVNPSWNGGPGLTAATVIRAVLLMHLSLWQFLQHFVPSSQTISLGQHI